MIKLASPISAEFIKSTRTEGKKITLKATHDFFKIRIGKESCMTPD